MREQADGAIDVVLDLLPPISGTAPVRAAALTVRPYGTVVLIGGIRAGLELPYAELMRSCITVRGQYMYPRDAPDRLVRIIRAGSLPLSDWDVTKLRCR